MAKKKKSAKTRKGKGKGPAWEREVARILSRWWTFGKRDDIFWRTAGSGARATVREKKGKKTPYQYSDITFTDPIGKPLLDLFCIELKKGYGKFDLLEVIDAVPVTPHTRTLKDGRVLEIKPQGAPLIIQFWGEICRDAYFSDRVPMLIFCRQNRKPVVAISKKVALVLVDFIGTGLFPTLTMDIGEPVVFFNLENFLDWLSPEIIRWIVNDEGNREKVGLPVRQEE